jgi:hypothetical protein
MVSALQENTHEYLSSLMDDVSGVEVIVKIYGDLFKMWQRYEEEGSSLGSSDLTRFFSHFNRTEPLVDFMDIGPRKESIVKKLSGMFSFPSSSLLQEGISPSQVETNKSLWADEFHRQQAS